MPTVSPLLILVVTVAVSAATMSVAFGLRCRFRQQLRALGRQHGYTFRPTADASLARRVMPHVPHMGAASVNAVDLLVSRQGTAEIIIAQVHYTIGAVRNRRTLTRLLALRQMEDGTVADVRIAPASSHRLDQYRVLLDDTR